MYPQGHHDTDSDGDGLCDVHERHKYFTDPLNRDSDNDGVPDGDWKERREFTYTIRTIIRVMPPYDKATLTDDYQDVRILRENDEYAEWEVIHYPLNTCGESIEANADWQHDYASMTEYLRPRASANWNEAMRADVLRELAEEGIQIEDMTDKEVVKQVSAWAMGRAKDLRMFTTYYIHFPGGKPTILPGLEEAFEKGKARREWSARKQFEHELLGREMFYHRTYGTCTSLAVYLTTILRAVGIPTRMIIGIPLVDPSDAAQLELVRAGITHHQLRHTILSGLEPLERFFAAHTFNEVFVGNRWHRLNGHTLGQNIVGVYGMMTHVHTFNDLSEARLAATWGARAALGHRSDAFQHMNPYTAMHVSDHFGKYAKVANPPVKVNEHRVLTITKVYWFHSEERPKQIPRDAVGEGDPSGHVLMHVKEWFEDQDASQYNSFYQGVDKEFILKAEGHPDVHASAERGFWSKEFYLRIPETEYISMARGVPYKFYARNQSSTFQWDIGNDVFLVRTQ